jgi:hypothetical protein
LVLCKKRYEWNVDVFGSAYETCCPCFIVHDIKTLRSTYLLLGCNILLRILAFFATCTYVICLLSTYFYFNFHLSQIILYILHPSWFGPSLFSSILLVCYKPEGNEFDSRWRRRIFQFA